ncbi:hypothetical protein ACFL3C_00880 [Patescibacteria group bacterium]
MSESTSGQTGSETERYSDEFIDGIISEIDDPTPKAEPGRMRHWYNNRVLGILGALGLGAAVGAAGGCKKEKKTPDLVTYSQGCYEEDNAKKFLKHQKSLEDDCVEKRKSWTDQRQSEGLLDLGTQQDGQKACKRYEKFLLGAQSEANKNQRNLKISHERRKTCRKLWKKLDKMVGENEVDNITPLGSNY